MVSTDQFEHIQKIQNEFREACKIERVRDSLNNAIQHLADGLYSERPHFIFELIQNAEDNTYAEQHTYQPFISFRLTKTDPTNSPGSDGALIIKNTVSKTGSNISVSSYFLNLSVLRDCNRITWS